MAWNVFILAEVDAWLLGLDEPDRDRIAVAIEHLAAEGPGLGRPMVDTVEGSVHGNMKELQRGSFRILFVFDPSRRAVLLLGGDKTGQWSRWYRTAVPLADRRYDEWLAEHAGKEGDHGQ